MMHSFWPKLAKPVISRWLVAAASLAWCGRAAAQTVRGIVVDAGNAPVPGVVVQLLDSSRHVVGRTLTDERGAFRVAAQRAGTYTIRTLRIGFRPTVSASITLAAHQAVERRLALVGLPASLDTIRVAARGPCRTVGDSGAAAFAVWEQAQAALTAAALTSEAKNLSTSTLSFERVLSRDGRHAQTQTATTYSGFLKRPWLAVSPDSLHARGYVVTDATGETRYDAPGLDMLESASFIADHCFRLTSDGARVGLHFEPTPDRRKLPEIQGVLWLDPATSELRELSYDYVHLSRQQEAEARGDARFARIKNGEWVITDWNIRMPVVARDANAGTKGSDLVPQLVEIQVAGGAVIMAARGADTMWSHPPVAISGLVIDSVSGRPVAGARVQLSRAETEVTNSAGRFSVVEAPLGDATLTVRTPSLDSINAAHVSTHVISDSMPPLEIRVPSAARIAGQLCGDRALDPPGMVFGRLAVSVDSGWRNVLVSAEWRADAPHGGGDRVPVHYERLDVRTDDRGAFRLCGVPTGIPITLRAGGAASAPTTMVEIPPRERFIHAALPASDEAKGSSMLSVFRGMVVGSDGMPIAGAEVAVTDVGTRSLTDSAGFFRLTVPVGRHRVSVRRIGVGAVETDLTFSADRAVQRRFELNRLTTLDSVVVTAAAVDKAMASFEDNRRLGLGSFLTRADLAALEGGPSTSSAMARLRGIRFVRGRGGRTWVAGRDGGRSIGASPEDRLHGAKPACYAQMYLDNMIVYHGNDQEPLFDVNSIVPAEIEGIEYYANPAETPAKYSGLNSPCGVVVIWTRRP